MSVVKKWGGFAMVEEGVWAAAAASWTRDHVRRAAVRAVAAAAKAGCVGRVAVLEAETPTPCSQRRQACLWCVCEEGCGEGCKFARYCSLAVFSRGVRVCRNGF